MTLSHTALAAQREDVKSPALPSTPAPQLPTVERLELDALPVGQISRLWVVLAHDGLGQDIKVPVMVAKVEDYNNVEGARLAVAKRDWSAVRFYHDRPGRARRPRARHHCVPARQRAQRYPAHPPALPRAGLLGHERDRRGRPRRERAGLPAHAAGLPRRHGPEPAHAGQEEWHVCTGVRVRADGPHRLLLQLPHRHAYRVHWARQLSLRAHQHAAPCHRPHGYPAKPPCTLF